jgi:hypothetical protein
VAALLAAALLQLVLAIAGYRTRGERRQNHRAVHGLQEGLMLMSTETAALGRRLSILEQQLSQASSRREEVPAPSGPIGQAYEVAVNLVRKGCSVQELVSTCGLSQGEAELIARMYRAPADGGRGDRVSAVKAARRTTADSAAGYDSSY